VQTTLSLLPSLTREQASKQAIKVPVNNVSKQRPGQIPGRPKQSKAKQESSSDPS
jgi:hypothetical protein